MSSPALWLISFRDDDKSVDRVKQLQGVTFNRGLTAQEPRPFKIPGLKVGTLDSLMALSEELPKTDAGVQAVVKKLERTYVDLLRDQEREQKTESKSSSDSNQRPIDLKVMDNSPESYVMKEFKWDNQRFPSADRTLRQLVEMCVRASTKADDTIKAQLSDYSDCKSFIQGIERRETSVPVDLQTPLF